MPAAGLARLALQVETALDGKTQELSRRLVEKALADGTDERWQAFLQVVQGSELPFLANTLDNDVVTFIKQVLDQVCSLLLDLGIPALDTPQPGTTWDSGSSTSWPRNPRYV